MHTFNLDPEQSKLGLVLDQLNLLVPDKLVLDKLLGLDQELQLRPWNVPSAQCAKSRKRVVGQCEITRKTPSYSLERGIDIFIMCFDLTAITGTHIH